MKAFIDSQFNYCSLVWMYHNRSVNNRINRIHERALRIAYKDALSSFEELLVKDKSVTIHERNLQKVVIEIYKVKNGLSPEFMKEIFRLSSNPYNLRNKKELKNSNIKTVYCGSETLSHRGPEIWSSVPDDIKNARSLTEFKAKIKKWKPESCTCRLCKTYIPQLGFI